MRTCLKRSCWHDLFFGDRISQESVNLSSAASADHVLQPVTTALKEAETKSFITLLFVDIDGVLNIGISDNKGALSCDEGNIVRAQSMSKKTRSQCSSAEMIVSVSGRHVDEENSTYGQLCKGSGQLSDIYVMRLAQVVAAAKTQGRVICVLSSNWRNKNTKGVRILEDALSKHMKERFTFDAKTDSEEIATPGGRLENIGRFLTELCATCVQALNKIRVLVLEDFSITPLNGWPCQGKHMTSAQDVEAYLRKCVRPSIDTAVCLVHTFDQWTTSSGMALSVGSGLTLKHFSRAMAFLNERIESIETVDIPFVRAVSDPVDGSFWNGEDCDNNFVRGVSCM